MNRKMRRAEKQLSDTEARAIIRDTSYGVLSLCKDNIPYSIPVNHAEDENTIYFHCANEGKKLDIIKENPYGHFVFVSKCEILQKQASTKYKSSMASGKLRFVNDNDERMHAYSLIIKKYMGQYTKEGLEHAEKHDNITTIIAMDIEYLSGKGSK